MCGEKEPSGAAAGCGLGSPPRVRGEDEDRTVAMPLERITPACAGRRWWSMPSMSSFWDHPRVCGEKAVVNPRFQSGIGSPPRVRGEVFRTNWLQRRRRITPACAGRSLHPFCQKSAQRDHPRVCGEKKGVDIVITHAFGSPPRVRGEARSVQKPEAVPGITPACAGRSPAST